MFLRYQQVFAVSECCSARITVTLKPALRALLLSCFLVGALPKFTWPESIVVGSIHTEAAAEIKRFLSFARHLGTQLRSEGISEGKVVVAKSIAQMASLLRERKVDLYIDSTFPSLAVSRLSGSKLFLRRWKKGVAEYHSLIFVKKDSGLSQPEDLKGKMIAFEEPSSSSGYFFPKVALTLQGLRLVLKTDPTQPVSPAEVGYVFSLDDENTMAWVLRGKVLAGAMDNHSYREQARESIHSLKIIYKTSSLPRHIVSYRSDLPPELLTKVREALITMDQSEEGRKVLQAFEQTTKFDELPAPTMTWLSRAGQFVAVELGLK
jgi:phosphonate transport system substrate-binding protein